MDTQTEVPPNETNMDENIRSEQLNPIVDRLKKETDRFKGFAVIAILGGGTMLQVIGKRYNSVSWLTSESVTLAATVIHHLNPEIDTICNRYAMIQERKRIQSMNKPQTLNQRDNDELKSGTQKLFLTIGFHALNKGIAKFMGEDSSILNLSKMIQKLLSGENKDFLGILQKIRTAFT